jgi:hypothetical protein
MIFERVMKPFRARTVIFKCVLEQAIRGKDTLKFLSATPSGR